MQENLLQDEKLATSCAAKEYLRRVSVIWSNPLSDFKSRGGDKPVCLACLELFDVYAALALVRVEKC